MPIWENVGMNEDGKRAGEYVWVCMGEGEPAIAACMDGVGTGAASGFTSGGMMRFGACFAWEGTGRRGGFEVETSAGISIRKPKKDTR